MDFDDSSAPARGRRAAASRQVLRSQGGGAGCCVLMTAAVNVALALDQQAGLDGGSPGLLSSPTAPPRRTVSPIFPVVAARPGFGEEGWRSVTRNCRRSTRVSIGFANEHENQKSRRAQGMAHAEVGAIARAAAVWWPAWRYDCLCGPPNRDHCLPRRSPYISDARWWDNSNCCIPGRAFRSLCAYII